MPPLLVVGESLVDVVVVGDERFETPGGSPLNVAVGLSRLGTAARLRTQIGADDRGELLHRYLAENGVQVDAEPSSTGRTSVAEAHLDAAGAAGYDFDLDWTLSAQPLPESAGLHVGSLGALLAPGREAVRGLVEEAASAGGFVSYDPNLRTQFLPGRDELDSWVRGIADQAVLVKLSEEDCGLLAPGTSVEQVVGSLLEGERTSLVLVTRGAVGASAYTAGAACHTTAPPVTVVDTVGAGDAFMAATLAQLAQGDLLERVAQLGEDQLLRLLRGAALVAALTCSRRGAAPPRRSELPRDWPD